ncbi:MAG: DUF349 domain-containing protein, partial [Salegentibacter mishustinae]|nr:DUF349 domain-containing protein [Salegentibacter mishustinae]
MSQQENDKSKEEFSNEATNNSEKAKNEKKLTEENQDENVEEKSFSEKSETEETSTEKETVIEPAETASEIKTDDDKLEDAMIAEAGDKKNTSEENKASSEEDDENDAILEESRKKTRPEEEKVQAETGAKTEDTSHEDDEDEDETSEEEGRTSKHHQEHIDDSVAEDSEDESKAERHDIPKKDYHAMSKEQLVDEFESLLKKEKVQAIKEHVIEIRAEFNAKFNEEEEEKKEEFLADGGNIIDFHYSTPIKKRFNSLYFDYREKRNNYYKQLKQDLNKNLDKRLEIIEELKGLIDVEENINTTYKHFKELQDRWRVAGPIPREKYNDVWNTYHHHVENFYDFLHLNREFRDLDFKHNLDQKLKVIDRAEELAQEADVNRAFRELQMLHKMWKEELGPVAKEF